MNGGQLDIEFEDVICPEELKIPMLLVFWQRSQHVRLSSDVFFGFVEAWLPDWHGLAYGGDWSNFLFLQGMEQSVPSTAEFSICWVLPASLKLGLFFFFQEKGAWKAKSSYSVQNRNLGILVTNTEIRSLFGLSPLLIPDEIDVWSLRTNRGSLSPSSIDPVEYLYLHLFSEFSGVLSYVPI